MTFNGYCKTKDGQTPSNVIVSCVVLETGQIFQRYSDGSGYVNLAIAPSCPYPCHVVVTAQDPRFANWTYHDDALKNVDQNLEIDLVPFR